MDSCNGDSHPRSQERASRDDEGGASSISRGDRTNGGQRGSNSGGSGGGGSARGIAGCGEAWGVAATTATAARASSDRMHGGGSGFGRGGKSSNSPEVWAWAGKGGGTARGKAMLNAYGLQADKHNPTCPRGTPGESVARHGRWQRNQDVRGARKVESGGGGGGAGNEGGGDSSCRSSEGGLGTTGQRRSGARAADGGRAGDKASDRVSAGQSQRFRGGKGRKHRSSAFPQDRCRVVRDRCPSENKATGGGHPVEDVAAEGCDGVGRCAGQAPPFAASSSGDHREGEGVLVKPGSRELAPQDHLLVLSRGSTASPHPSSGCSALPTTTSTATTTTTSGHTATTTLSMDGRGGSAAPPHRPSLTAAVSTTSYAPVLPDLATAMGTGVAGGAEVMTAFEADSGCGDTFGEGGGGGGDDHSTPPVSRQRSHSHHSPWQARKHPRGFRGGRVGRHQHASHRGYHPHERSRVEERPRSGSTTTGGRIGSCYSSESTEMVDSASSSSACAVGAWAAGAAPPPATTTFPNARKAVDGSNNGPASASEPRETHGRPTSSGNPAPSSRSVVAVAPAEPSEQLGVFGEAGRRWEGGDLDPFERLLRPHHSSGGHGSTSVVPQSELIDHFKLATRPTSRRGTRKPGSGGGGEGAGGGCCTPEPAFCLFSRGAGGVGTARD